MNEKQIDRYLFNELPESDREQFENDLVGDDELFYEIAERENELVDRYAKGELKGDERARFENSLDELPALRQRVANAKLLHEFILDERPVHKTITIAERSGLFSRLFSFGPAFQFASAGLIIILAIASVSLWSENRRLMSLQKELAASHQRETDLASRVEEENATTGDLAADLESERQRIAALEADIAKLRNGKEPERPSNPPVTIATLVLSTVAIRGDAIPVRRLELSPGIARVSIVAGIPGDAAPGDRVSVMINGEEVADNAKVSVRRGEKSVAVTVPAAKLKAGQNVLSILDGSDAVAARYIIAVTQR